MIQSYRKPRHPIHYVQEILSSAPQDTTCFYSTYLYKPQSLTDIRKEYTLKIEDLNYAWLDFNLSMLKENRELAFHSKVTISGATYHIPMIDLGGRSREIANIPIIKELADSWKINFAIYSSGRSYHLYGNKLLTDSDWIKFMGSLLLLNLPGKSKLIDTRWIGHRLLAGYASLRWSNNTNQYKRYPIHIGGIEELANESPHSISQFDTPI